MRLVEVNTPELEKRFLKVQVELYADDPQYIRPLDKDINDVFDKSKNKFFRFGTVARWVLEDNNGKGIGRIAAFVNKKYKNKGDAQSTGGFGFFDCINSQEAATILLDAAKNWLQAQGMEAMDGPINFGERDRWWGLLVEGFDAPLYCMNYNFPYYRNLLENYGCQVFYYQNCYSREIKPPLSEKFYKAHAQFKDKPEFKAIHIDKNNLEKFAIDFCEVYNSAWASHEGNKQMAPEQAKKLFKTMKPVMDPEIVWFTYHNEKPVAFYINLPDLNQVFRYLNGKFDLWAKLKFLFYKQTGAIKRFTGIIFGIAPEFQGTGVDYFMIVEAAKVIQPNTRYTQTELQWMGDFNPKINNIAKNLEFTLSRRLATYRYLFDRIKEFKRHPLL